MNELEKDVNFLVEEFAKLTGKAFKEAKEKSVEPEMLNALRENIKFLITILSRRFLSASVLFGVLFGRSD